MSNVQIMLLNTKMFVESGYFEQGLAVIERNLAKSPAIETELRLETETLHNQSEMYQARLS